MLNFKFSKFSNKIVCKSEKVDDNEFENDENKRKNKKNVT